MVIMAPLRMAGAVTMQTPSWSSALAASFVGGEVEFVNLAVGPPCPSGPSR